MNDPSQTQMPCCPPCIAPRRRREEPTTSEKGKKSHCHVHVPYIITSCRLVDFFLICSDPCRREEGNKGNEERRYCHGFRNTVQEANLSQVKEKGVVFPIVLDSDGDSESKNQILNRLWERGQRVEVISHVCGVLG
jgi:hypothetical protein